MLPGAPSWALTPCQPSGTNGVVQKNSQRASVGPRFTQPWLRSVFGVTSPIADNIWWGIQPISAGLWGVPLGFIVIIVVSMLTKAPGKDIQELVEHVRFPSLDGKTSQGSAAH